LIALKTILKEIDPFAFDESLRMGATQKKQYAVKQDEDDRKNLDKRWDKLNGKLKQTDPAFAEPDCKTFIKLNYIIVPYRQSALIRDFNELYMKIYDKEKFMNL
jgi:hypothetical protein